MQLDRPRDAAKGTLVAAIAALLLASSRTQAQQQTQLAVSGGVATDQRGVRSNALSIAPSISLMPSRGVAISLSANATRFGNSAWSLGGGGAFSGRDAIAGPFALTLDALANASWFQGQGTTSASFALGEVLPALQLNAGPVTLFGGARAATGHTSQNFTQQSLPVFNGSPTTQSQTRTGFGPTFGISVNAVSSPAGTFRLGAREDRLSISGLMATDRALTANIATSVVSFTGSVGRRSASDENVGFGSAALSIALRGDVTLDAAAGRYASNRLTGTPAGDYVSVGLSLRFGRASTPVMPTVRGAPSAPPGHTRLTLEAPDATRVEVAGDFNEWKPFPANRAANGVWYADFRIAPGQYRYAFRVNGKEWRVPRGATAVNDGYGGKSAWLTVGETGS